MQNPEVKKKLDAADAEQLRRIITALEVQDGVLLSLLTTTAKAPTEDAAKKAPAKHGGVRAGLVRGI